MNYLIEGLQGSGGRKRPGMLQSLKIRMEDYGLWLSGKARSFGVFAVLL